MLTIRRTATGLDVYRNGVRVGEIPRDDLPALIVEAAKMLRG